LRFSPTNIGSFTNSAIVTTGNAGNVTNWITGSAAISPAANFTASPVSGDWPLSVGFTELSTGTITNSYWEFGDGSSSNTVLLTLTHSYSGMGTNTVSLTVTGPLGTDTLTRSNYIVITNVPPVALGILLVSNQVQLTWREGTLQAAGSVTDTYTNVPDATSPYTLPPFEATRYFRVKVR
jgi:PKD repeat protein